MYDEKDLDRKLILTASGPLLTMTENRDYDRLEANRNWDNETNSRLGQVANANTYRY